MIEKRDNNGTQHSCFVFVDYQCRLRKKQVSARAIATEAQRIIACHQAVHARAIQEQYERESEAQLKGSRWIGGAHMIL